MKKKILFLLVLISSVLFSQDAMFQGKSSLENEMQQIINVNPKQGNLFKGYLYEFGYPKENIKKDIPTALKYYKKAFEDGSPVAAFKLGMYAWAYEDSQHKETYKPLQYFLAAKDFQPKAQARLNLIAAGIYLYQKQKFNQVLNVLKEPLKFHNPVAEFYTAVSYYALQNDAMANIFLTKACTNKKRPSDIEKFCTGNQNVEKVDLNSPISSNTIDVKRYNNNIGITGEKASGSCLN